jgi:hypothetical protein
MSPTIPSEEEEKFRELLRKASIETEFDRYFSNLTPAEKLEEFQLLEQLIENETGK